MVTLARMAASEPTDRTGAVPPVDTWSVQERRQGRHAQTYDWWATVLTWAHTRWLERRDRSPWLYVLPIAAVAAFLVG